MWNLSLTGWRFFGNLPLRGGEVCSLTVNLSSQQWAYVAAGIVRWVRGEECGVETLADDDESREDYGAVPPAVNTGVLWGHPLINDRPQA